MTLSPGRSLTWAALSFTGFVASLFAVLPFLVGIQLVWDAPRLAQMGAWSLVWGVLSALGVLVAARLSFGSWLMPRPLGIGILAIGIGLSAILNVVLQQWEISRFGITEPELVGLMAGLFAMLIGLAVAAFGAFLVPRQLIGWPLAAVVFGFVAFALIVAGNLPGLSDGIAAESWPLAIWVGLSGLYALITTGLVMRRALDRSTEKVGT
ncbi:MAG: hypothetical protein H0W81_05550 [Chloroflexi bacterium]|nr:hypothetical protein [Chloroflexota bacterium]